MSNAELAVPPSMLLDLLRLNAETGVLTWKPRNLSYFSNGKWSAEHLHANWSARFSEKLAFTSAHINGYLSGCINNQRFLAHRVVFAMHFGRWPSDGIDHINGDKKDNRISNLRKANHSVNARNTKVSTKSSTRILGVTFDKARGKYFACIYVNGKTKSLGRFASIEDAKAARAAANIQFEYHQNHGRTSSCIF